MTEESCVAGIGCNEWSSQDASVLTIDPGLSFLTPVCMKISSETWPAEFPILRSGGARKG
jgi:hypothetical protein